MTIVEMIKVTTTTVETMTQGTMAVMMVKTKRIR
jgi:hypothetical protein